MVQPERCPQCGTRLPPDGPPGVCPRCVLGLGRGADPAAAGDAVASTSARAGRFVAPTVSELGPHFPQFEILELLGQGGMGAVYRARQKTLDRIVALKILPSEIGQDPAFAERFTREARALARLAHPNIVTVFDFGQADAYFYFVMEYVDGVNLRQSLQAGHLSPPEALAIVPQICDALQYAHEEGVVHRDIKPENVLLDRKGRVKIADFGLAKLVGLAPGALSLTGTGQVVGTPQYMAPEQVERPLSVDHRADIYSLGVVFYELLTGELPLGRFDPPSHRAGVPVDLDRVVLRALQKEPARRYQHASEVKTDVESVSDRPRPIPRGPAAQPAGSTCRVPFTIGGLYLGLAEAKGILRLEGRVLQFEFEVKDGLGGLLRSGVQTVHVAVGDIESIEFGRRWVSYRLRIRTRHLGSLRDVPGSDAGRIDLHIHRHDRDAARQLVAAARDQAGLRGERERAPADSEPFAAVKPSAEAEQAAVRQRLRWPANGLLATGILDCAIFLPLLIAGAAALLMTWDVQAPPRPPNAPRPAMEMHTEDGVITVERWDQPSAPAPVPPTAVEAEPRSRRVPPQAGGHSTMVRVSRHARSRLTLGLLVAAGVITLLTVPIGAVLILAGGKMKRLQAYPLVTTGAVLGVLPIHPAFPIGMLFGIWSLTVLAGRATRQGFRQQRQASRVDKDRPPVAQAPPGKPPKPAELEWERARAELKAPGVAFVVLGIVNIFPLVIVPLFLLGGGLPGMLELLLLAMLAFVGAVQLAGGLGMQSGRNYGTATAATVLSLVPCTPFWLFGLPFGIWALLLLQRTHVQRWFNQPG